MQVSKDEIEIASNVNLVDYLNSIGENLKRDGANYYRHALHDSLVINTRRNYFSWNSQSVSGNAITYLMNVYRLSFQESVKKINEDIGNKIIKKYEPNETVYLDEFTYDIKPGKNTKNIESYLIHERKIDEHLVKQLIKGSYIEEDIYKNVVFKWKNGDKVIGASLQGTVEIPQEKRINPERAYFKKEMPTTEKATFTGFTITKGYPENLYFFESPIDLLSYISLNKRTLSNCRLVSMNGLKGKTVIQSCKEAVRELLKNNKDISSIKICVDNDPAGREFIEKLKGYQYKKSNGEMVPMEEELPSLPKGREKWDWNDELKAAVKEVNLERKFEVSELEI